jgi:hypothetical protein
MEVEAGPGFGFTSFDTFMSSRQRYRPLLVGILWGSFLLMKTFRYDVMIWHCSYVWWSMNMNWSWCLSFSLLDGGSMKRNKATYRMIMIYKQRGVPTIYWSAIVQFRYIKILQTARLPHYLRMSCELFSNMFYKQRGVPTIYWPAIVQYRYIKILQTASLPHYLRMSCELFLNMFYKQRGVPTIYWPAIVQFRYIKILQTATSPLFTNELWAILEYVLQTARLPHYLRMSCELFLNMFYK